MVEKCMLNTGRKSVLVSGVMISLAISLAACSTKGTSVGATSDPITTGSLDGGSLRSTVAARRAWQADRKDLRKGMAYARQLQALQQDSEQLRVLEQLIKYHPDNTKLLVFYGKRLIANGQSKEAVNILKQAERRGERDWRLYSALGSALDQTGKNTQARMYYQRALKLNPGEVKVENNMAMSYVLEGKFASAERILRKANNTPKGRALPRIRQNLALVVGLQGRFDEARQIASRDLPPEQVEANMAYLKKMMSSNNTWNKLKKS
ncbi:MAG TPA: pilus assembly protein TadD [Rhizobiales bacterium]|nr:pilus assembly protein TadD [Hyphomicrobiales bacterium]